QLAEHEHLGIRQSLAAEAQHEIVEPGFAYRCERIASDRLGDIDARHLSAERFADPAYGDRGHGPPGKQNSTSSPMSRPTLRLTSAFDARTVTESRTRFDQGFEANKNVRRPTLPSHLAWTARRSASFSTLACRPP